MNECCSNTAGPKRGLTRRGLLGVGVASAAGVLAAGTSSASAQPPRGSVAGCPEPSQLVGDVTGYNSRLVLLGTAGGPLHYPGRSGMASAVTVGGRSYLVDAGRSATRRIGQSGITPESLGAVLITHMHSDHIADIFNVFMLNVGNYLNAPPSNPVSVYGPGVLRGKDAPRRSGTENMLKDLARAFTNELFVRNAESPSKVSFSQIVRGSNIELPPTVKASAENPAPRMKPFTVMEDDRVRVTATLVPHGASFPSFAFRFDTEDGSVTFSGDTAKSENLAHLAADTDILVHEAVSIDYFVRLGLPPALIAHLEETHTSPEDVGRIATTAGAMSVVLSHLGPGDPAAVTDEEWVSRVKKTYSGSVTSGHDLTQFGIGARG